MPVSIHRQPPPAVILLQKLVFRSIAPIVSSVVRKLQAGTPKKYLVNKNLYIYFVIQSTFL